LQELEVTMPIIIITIITIITIIITTIITTRRPLPHSGICPA
jgi:hypothetical protein